MNRILIVGHFGWNTNTMIGAAVKARNIYTQLSSKYGGKSVKAVDIFNWKKKKIRVFLRLFFSTLKCRDVILVISDTSGKLLSFSSFFTKVFKKRFYYVAVGSHIGDYLTEHRETIKNLLFFAAFFVETSDCLLQMKQIGLSNVFVMKNFKRLQPTESSKSYRDKVFFHFCTFSRVNELKGILHAIKAIEIINSEQESPICDLSIFGEIEEGFKSTFDNIIQDNECIKYCGIVDSNDSVRTLVEFDCLLFPTLYETEGIPGTLVDAFASGLPIICSRWKRCDEIVQNNYNGITYSFGSIDGLVNSIKMLISDTERMEALSCNSLKSYELYNPDNAVLSLTNVLEARWAK